MLFESQKPVINILLNKSFVDAFSLKDFEVFPINVIHVHRKVMQCYNLLLFYYTGRIYSWQSNKSVSLALGKITVPSQLPCPSGSANDTHASIFNS